MGPLVKCHQSVGVRWLKLGFKLLQDDKVPRLEPLSPGRGRLIQQGVLGDASNREPSPSPNRRTPRAGKRKKGEVCDSI